MCRSSRSAVPPVEAKGEVYISGSGKQRNGINPGEHTAGEQRQHSGLIDNLERITICDTDRSSNPSHLTAVVARADELETQKHPSQAIAFFWAVVEWLFDFFTSSMTQ